MNKKMFLITLSVILILTALGAAYALLIREDNTDMQSYTTGVLEIVANKNADSITLTNSIPMSDGNGSISKPYSFVIANTGNLRYKFNVMLLSTEIQNQISSEYIKIKVNDESIKTLDKLDNGIILKDVILESGGTMEIDLRVWLSNTTPNTEIGKVFNAKLTTEGKAIYTEEPVNAQNLQLY